MADHIAIDAGSSDVTEMFISRRHCCVGVGSPCCTVGRPSLLGAESSWPVAGRHGRCDRLR